MGPLVSLDALSSPQYLGALAIDIIVIMVARFVLKLALKAIIIVAIAAAVLWFLGISVLIYPEQLSQLVDSLSAGITAPWFNSVG